MGVHTHIHPHTHPTPTRTHPSHAYATRLFGALPSLYGSATSGGRSPAVFSLVLKGENLQSRNLLTVHTFPAKNGAAKGAFAKNNACLVFAEDSHVISCALALFGGSLLIRVAYARYELSVDADAVHIATRIFFVSAETGQRKTSKSKCRFSPEHTA